MVGWDELKKVLVYLMDRFTLLPRVVSDIAIGYCAPVQWENQPRQTWVLPKGSSPRGITTDGIHLFICDEPKDCVLQYTLDGKLVEVWQKSSLLKSNPPKSLFVYPKGIDMDMQHGLMYVVDWTNLKSTNFKKEIISSCILPFSSLGGHCVKVDREFVYVTIYGRNQVFVYQSTGGGKLNFFNKIGNEKEGSGPGEFNKPHGIAFDIKNIYICDAGNKRIQVLKKSGWKYSHEWGSIETKTQQESWWQKIRLTGSNFGRTFEPSRSPPTSRPVSPQPNPKTSPALRSASPPYATNSNNPSPALHPARPASPNGFLSLFSLTSHHHHSHSLSGPSRSPPDSRPTSPLPHDNSRPSTPNTLRSDAPSPNNLSTLFSLTTYQPPVQSQSHQHSHSRPASPPPPSTNNPRPPAPGSLVLSASSPGRLTLHPHHQHSPSTPLPTIPDITKPDLTKPMFENPVCIHHYEGVIYVGDTRCIQLFTPEGILIQKMSSEEGIFAYHDIRDLLVIGDRLFVSDQGIDRIHVFRCKKEKDTG